MGQRNIHMVDLDSDQQAQDFIQPEPCLFYGSMANFPQPNVHAMLPAPGVPGNFNLHHVPDHHENALFYGMAQYNRYPAANLDLAVASSSNHYAPYLAPSAPRDFPVPVNHGTHEQLPFSSNPRAVGIPADNYGRNNPYVDGVRSKRKNAEGLPWNFQYCDTLAGSSSSVAPMSTRLLESDVTMTDAALVPFVSHEYVGNDASPAIEGGSHRSVRNRSGIIVPDPVTVHAHNANNLVQGNFVNQTFHVPANPWLGFQFNGNSADVNAVTWNQQSTLPYLHGSINGGCVDVNNVGLPGYQVTTNRSSNGFLHATIPPGHPSMHHPPPPPIQGVRGHNTNFPSQIVTSLRRFSINSGSISSFQGILEEGPRYMGPVPPSGFRLYRPHRREVTPEMSSRHRNIPHLRVLPEDGVAMLEVPGIHEVADSPDQHRDMRLDIDHMSYEELLALGEQIGSVGNGFSEISITSSLKTRLFASSAVSSNFDEAASLDQEVDFCVICQTEYKDQDKIATLDCSHEYHVDCIKKWLLVKNTCPVCKSTALTAGAMHS